MKRCRILALFLLSVAGTLLLSESAFARDRGWGHHHHHDHWRGSVYIGVPFYYGYHRPYYDPYWDYPRWDYPRYPRTIVIERERRADVGSGPPPAQYWYYCDSVDAYYPYVENCPEGWQEVPATPPDVQ